MSDVRQADEKLIEEAQAIRRVWIHGREGIAGRAVLVSIQSDKRTIEKAEAALARLSSRIERLEAVAEAARATTADIILAPDEHPVHALIAALSALEGS